MKRRTWFLLVILIFITTGAFAQTNPSETRPESKAFETESSTAVTDVPGQHFQKAHENFIKRDTKATASEIRKGAGFLATEAQHATGETKKGLEASARELERLANDVEKGTVSSVKKLDETFARADHALARYHLAQATNAWAKRENAKTGEALRSASTYLEHGLAWTGRKAETGTEDVIHHSRVLAGKLIEGTGWVPEEVGKGIQSVGNEIDKLGQKVG